ncbi:hypothetical protein GGI43DRAFT_433917 [Trichoderma evansii]
MDTSLDIPTTWSWRCHECHRSHPMACTQRCLSCSHKICFPDETIKQNSEDSCSITFDLPSWRNFYRRRQELKQQSSSNEEQQTAAAGEAPEQHTEEPARDNDYIRPGWLVKMTNGTYSCFTDCKFPSECFLKIAIERITKLSDQPLSSLSQSTRKTLIRTPKKAEKYKSRGYFDFKRVPSPLSQEWHIDTVSDET